ncbi:hypothetical protein Bbelb_156140 [Branchiostoma belcheri]|nr:hypothetical protein Bbelb_156140 [Branchiostoma belcheri]
MEQKFDAALPYERREKLRASRRRQWCQPFLKFPSAREHFRLLPTRAEDESRGLPRPFPTLCAHVTYPVRKGSWECATPCKGVWWRLRFDSQGGSCRRCRGSWRDVRHDVVPWEVPLSLFSFYQASEDGWKE